MKLHLAVSKDNLRPALKHIQIKGGFIYATNCHILAKIPVNELFKDVFTDQDELYILGDDWKKQGFSKCSDFKRNGNLLEAYDNKWNLQGIIKMRDKTEIICLGRFPDCETVIPQETALSQSLDKISFNPSLLSDLCKLFSQNTNNFIYTFFGQTKTIKVNHKNMQGIGIIMPIAMHD
jgi:hypothetical protein